MGIGYIDGVGHYQAAAKAPVASDAVNHPAHYTSHPSGVECIDITEHYNFCVGNSIKYLWRQGLKIDADKDPTAKQIEDCEKAIWYINRHIKNLKKETSV